MKVPDKAALTDCVFESSSFVLGDIDDASTAGPCEAESMETGLAADVSGGCDSANGWVGDDAKGRMPKMSREDKSNEIPSPGDGKTHVVSPPFESSGFGGTGDAPADFTCNSVGMGSCVSGSSCEVESTETGFNTDASGGFVSADGCAFRPGDDAKGRTPKISIEDKANGIPS